MQVFFSETNWSVFKTLHSMASFCLAFSLVLYTVKITSKHLFLHQQTKRNKLILPDNMVSTAQHPVGARSHRLIPTLLLLLLLVCVPDFLLMVLLPKLEWNWIQQNILNVGTLAILFHFHFKWLLPSECIMSTDHLTLHFVTHRPNLRVWIESRTFVSKSALKQEYLPQTGHGEWLPVASCCT